jgi:hypothetical protein
VLREHDVLSGVNIELISQTVRFALDREYDVVLDGIFYAAHYSEMLPALWMDHVGRTFHYYLDVSFEETVRRHVTHPQSNEFSVDAMRTWYHERDLLHFVQEALIPERSSLDETLERILKDIQGSMNGAVKHDVAQSGASTRA